MRADTSEEPWDCLVIGGGPAGLTAAIYLARFHLSVLVADDGRSRAVTIPNTRNHAGFPEGISGDELIGRMREQARLYGTRLEASEVTSLEADAKLLVARTSDSVISARTILLATGVVNRRPAMADDLHDEALARGLLRYCPICDGYEVTDRPVAVIGTGERGVNEAEFLRSYTGRVTLIPPDRRPDLDPAQRERLIRAGIDIVEDPCLGFELVADQIGISLSGGMRMFASVYPALGSDVRSELAANVGAAVSREGCLVVDAHQRTNIAGLYAAGDVVLGLDQISNAMGQGGIAATTIRNDLADRRPLRR